jgi:hypothetical protein
LLLADLQGNVISNLTSVAFARTFAYGLFRPASCSFVVPADDTTVGGLHTDGFPRLDAGRRTIRAYRLEDQADGTQEYVLRFNGYVWQIEDGGDIDHSFSAVTCFDPLQLASKRFLGLEANDDITEHEYASQPVTDTARDLIDLVNAVGETGIDSGGTETGSAASQAYVAAPDQQLGPALGELAAGYTTYEYELTPIDDTLGKLVRFDTYAPQKGATRVNAPLGYLAPPNNVAVLSRMVDMEQYANVLWGQASSEEGSEDEADAVKTYAPGIASYRRHEVSVDFGEVDDTALDRLATNELVRARGARERFVVTPLAGKGPMPWDDFNLGDRLPLYVGASFRGGFSDYVRVAGFELAVDDDGVESVTSLYAETED